MKVHGSIITDCGGPDTQGRLTLRFSQLFGTLPTFTGLHVPADELWKGGVQAAGILVDQLDVACSLPSTHTPKPMVILVNSAPRGTDVHKKYDNGTPFCYFRVGHILVVSTFEGHALSLVRDLGIVKEVQVMEIPQVMDWAVNSQELTRDEADRIAATQFRSLEFQPLAAWWLIHGLPVPSASKPLTELPDMTNMIWSIDSFGNVKTTWLKESIGFVPGEQHKLAGGETATCVEHLADVDDGDVALTVGSSGFGLKRFVELVIQQVDAGEKLGLSIGDPVLAELPAAALKAA